MAPEEVRLLFVGKLVTGAASALIAGFEKKVIVPFFRGLGEKASVAEVRRNVTKYVKNLEHRIRNLPSIAIPAGNFPLEQVYEPLILVHSEDEREFLVDGFPRRVLDFNRCLAITDDAGMGKSTLAKFIARRAIAESQCIPLLIELRRVRSSSSIFDSITSELAGSLDPETAKATVKQIFGSGNFIFILDGFDEVDEEAVASITDEIIGMAQEFPFCFFILTSRPGYAMSAFADFSVLQIAKLKENQAHSLIRRYDGRQGRASSLIKKVDGSDVKEFLGNPLLVTLLYRAFDYRPTIPPKRSTFFRQVYEALFQDHDLSKGGAYERKKESGLDLDDFNRAVRAIGFETYKARRVSYERDELLQHVESALKRTQLRVDSQKIVNDLIRSVPLFCRDGLEYRWSHKAMQEYFASQYILLDLASRRAEIVSKIFESQDLIKYAQLLQFLAEADSALMWECCVEPTLQNFCTTAKTETDFGLMLFQSAVDVYYVGNLGSSGGRAQRFEVLVNCVEESFGIRVAGRLNSVHFLFKEDAAFLFVMKDLGQKVLMLPVVDSECFSKLGPARQAQLLHQAAAKFGDQKLHLNQMIEVCPEYDRDSLLRIGLAALNIHPPSLEICSSALQKSNERRVLEKSSALLEF